MVKRSFSKTVLRCFKSNTGRFLSIFAIILLGIAFVTGLGNLTGTIKKSFSAYLTQQNTADIVVKSTSPSGFSIEEIDALKADDDVLMTSALTSIDTSINDENARIYVADLKDASINKLSLVDGKFPENFDEIVVERESTAITKKNIGDKITVLGQSKTIVGIVANPFSFCLDGDIDLVEQNPLQLIAYIEKSTTPVFLPLPTTDIYLKIHTNHNFLSIAYDDQMKSKVASLESQFEDYVFLTLAQNVSYATLEAYNEKVDVIAAIFPIFFIAVSALTVLTTMTRLVEEERPIVGCYLSLGISNGKVFSKYLSYPVITCLLASIIGLFSGAHLLPSIIYPAFKMRFFLPPMVAGIQYFAGLIASGAMLIAVAGTTFYVLRKEMKGNPATILRAKAPKAGKKILLERIPFIWNPLPFKYKSTLRNIFRYVNHFIMTVISVSGSVALVFAGFALLNISSGVNDSFAAISSVVIIFALLLSIFVVYNLTNMNIAERKREIATLKVLGYHHREVTGYIYREIFIMALVGILIGIPLGYGLMYFVMTYLKFGKMSEIAWYTPLLSGGIMILFIGIVDLLLIKKITSIEMTSSLKSID